MATDNVTSDDLDIAARTVWAEARGEGEHGMRAVAHVIINRAAKGGWWGDTLETVCQKPWQFSCWNENDPNREKLIGLDKTHPEYVAALKSVSEALVAEDDPTMGSCHYHTKAVQPDWSEGKEPVAMIGNHKFFSDID